MRDLDPDRVDELVDVYRAHNEPLHETLESFDGVLDLLPVLRAEGRRLGIVTAKRRATVELAFDRFPSLRDDIEVLVGAEDTERHKPDPDPVLEGLRRLERGSRATRRTSATHRSTSVRRRRPERSRSPSRGAGSTRPSGSPRRSRTRIVSTTEELHAVL